MDQKQRKIVVSPTVNTPEPFAGFGGFCGWPRICRLRNGDEGGKADRKLGE